MRKILFVLLMTVLTAMTSCSQNSKPSSKLVLISIDGAADWVLDDLLARGVLEPDGAFGQMIRNGLHAEQMIPVSIAATAISHVSIFTGSAPEKNGIVANSFLMPSESIGDRTSGFSAPIEAETIWSAAKRQGKSVMLFNAAGVDDTSPQRRGTFTLSYGKVIANSVVADLKASGSMSWKLDEEKFEHSAGLLEIEASPAQLSYQLRSGKTIPVFALAVDRLFDDKESYDAVILDFDQDLANGYAGVLQKKQWSEIKFEVDEQKVAPWSYLMNLEPDLSNVRVYLGTVGFNPGSPDEFIKEIEDQIGMWPCEQDNRKLSQGLITEEMWFDQIKRLTNYYEKLLLHNVTRDDWDLLFGYFSLVDDVQHRFLLKDARQLDYDLENGKRRKRYADYVDWSYKEMDRILAKLMEAAPPETNFVIISDHGMSPIHSVLLINNFLAEKGFTVGPKEAEVRAYSTGPAAHVYVNVAGRQKEGVVAADQLDDYVEKIVTACKELKDPVTGKPFFEVVLKNSELDQLQLNYPGRSGDVFVNGYSGWSLSSKIRPSVPVFVPNSFTKDTFQHLEQPSREFLTSGFMNETGLGVHGHLGTNRKMHAIFYAIGPDIPNKKLGAISALDVAPTVSAFLGIEPPHQSQGSVVFRSLE